MSTPLDQVLARSVGGFTPRHPEREPWVQHKPIRREVAFTGDVVTVPLEAAGRSSLSGLDRVLGSGPAYHTGELWEDMTPQSWGVSTP